MNKRRDFITKNWGEDVLEAIDSCEGDWWPLITIDEAWVPLEEFFVMCKERKCK